jgi:glucose/mannose-6-phosphate isomerase
MKDLISIHDKSDMLSVLRNTPKDVEKSLVMYSGAGVDTDLSSISNIVMCGMGGSAIACEIVAEIFNSGMYGAKKIPVFVNRYYSLPNFVSENTLVILSSYSGNTEETLSAAQEALSKTKNIVCISAGGKLTEYAKENDFPLVTLPGGYQPRCAFYFPFTALLMFFANSGLFGEADKIKQELSQIPRLLSEVSHYLEDYTHENQTYALAHLLHGKLITIYSEAGLFSGIALRIRQQIQENAKHFITGNTLPEMNHNEINSWRFPEEIDKENRIVIFLRDCLNENPRIALRYEALSGILQDYRIDIADYTSEVETVLENIYSTIYFFDIVSFYLAHFNEIDPTEIPDILFLKDYLARDGK